MLKDGWRQFQSIIQYTFGVLACILNTFLILLIIFKSPKNLGNYRYLMIYISVFEVFYACFDMFLEPTIHTHGVSLSVFVDVEDFQINYTILLIMIAIWCGCFGFSLAIFGVHFIYRYGAIEPDFRRKYLEGYKFVLWFFAPVIYGMWWGFAHFFLLRPTPEMSQYIRSCLLLEYDLKVENVAFSGPYFWHTSSIGYPTLNLRSFVGIGEMSFMIVTSMYCVFYFGINCYFKIRKALEMTKAFSNYTKRLQSQLFNALVAQTIIPLVLMHIPVSIVFLCPVMNIELGFATRFIGVTIAIYPGIDPLPTIIIIKSYRNAVKKMFYKLFKCYRSEEESVDIDREIPHRLKLELNAL